ncbi:MAG TPA: DUF805 domain-containing protein [Xanthobacteraceae bacterium]|nr:DUF805 domain-containing protein [Xanthobacteraceae bacterium]
MRIGTILFSFRGRLNRLRFFLAGIGVWVLGLSAIVAATVFLLSTYHEVGRDLAFVYYNARSGVRMACALFQLAVAILLTWSSAALCVKRYHDLGLSGWFALLGFVPLLGAVVFLILSLVPGSAGENQYGADPRTLDADAVRSIGSGDLRGDGGAGVRETIRVRLRESGAFEHGEQGGVGKVALAVVAAAALGAGATHLYLSGALHTSPPQPAAPGASASTPVSSETVDNSSPPAPAETAIGYPGLVRIKGIESYEQFISHALADYFTNLNFRENYSRDVFLTVVPVGTIGNVKNRIIFWRTLAMKPQDVAGWRVGDYLDEAYVDHCHHDGPCYSYHVLNDIGNHYDRDSIDSCGDYHRAPDAIDPFLVTDLTRRSSPSCGLHIYTASEAEEVTAQIQMPVSHLRNGHDVVVTNGNRYDGEWRNGLRNGHGVETYTDGETYDGEWSNDAWNGQGILSFTDGDHCEGQWNVGKPVKETFVCTTPSGNTYVGSHCNGMRCGYGTETTSDGNRYEGNFVNDEFNGHGVVTLRNGDRYEGQFANDFANGQGTYVTHDGRTYVGIWTNGCFKNAYVEIGIGKDASDCGF